MSSNKSTQEKLTALTEFAQAIDAITITDYFSGRLENFYDRTYSDEGDEDDHERWTRVVRGWRKLQELGILDRPSINGQWVADD